MSETFSQEELSLVQSAKRTLMILAKVIRDKNAEEVVKDPDLVQLIANKTLEEALADPELGDKIRSRVTPDLPQLNEREEAVVVTQLASAVFRQLTGTGSDDGGGPG